MKPLFATLGSFLICSVVFSQIDSATIYFQKALEEKTSKRYLVASGYFQQAETINPKFEEAYLQDAYVNLEMRKTDAAKALFEKVYEINPNNTTAVKELTDLYYSYHQYNKALEFAQKCNGCPNSERIIAMCSYEQEDYNAAINGLQNALAKNPNDAEANYIIARSYLELEEDSKAIPYYKRAVEIDSSKVNWIYELGVLYYDQNDDANAILFFNRAAADGYPRSNDFNENLGYAYIYHGEFNKGEPLLLAILDKRPNDKDILRGLSEAYYKNKLYDKSLVYCQKLMELDPKDAKALYQAGLCFQQKGEKDKGQKMCDAAIEIDPSLSNLKHKQSEDMGL